MGFTDPFNKVGDFFSTTGSVLAGFGDLADFLFTGYEWWIPGVLVGAVGGAYLMGSLTGGAQGFGAFVGGIGGFAVSYELEQML
jgi:hypothetical protein